MCLESLCLDVTCPILQKKKRHRWSWKSYYRDEGPHNNKNCPPDRWNQIQADQKIDIKDWRTKGEHISVLQRPGDTSLRNPIAKHGSYEGFISYTVNEIRNYTDRKIVVSPVLVDAYGN